MILLQQGGRHIAAALMQLLLDWLVFVAATAAGLPPVPGNLLGRSSGALLGFWLNSRYTFPRQDGRRHGWKHFARFFVLWLLMTTASSWLLAWAAHALGLHMAWLAKPLVEGGLAVLKFSCCGTWFIAEQVFLTAWRYLSNGSRHIANHPPAQSRFSAAITKNAGQARRFSCSCKPALSA